jgi:hypothetical protein
VNFLQKRLTFFPMKFNPADLFSSGKLYYHPSKLTINDIVICFFAVVLPDAFFLLLLLTFPGLKYFIFSKKLLLPFAILIIAAIEQFIVGHANLAGGGVSLPAGLYFLLVRTLPLFFLIEGNDNKRNLRTTLFIQFSLIYIILSFLIDALLFKTYNDRRQLILLGHLEPGNSTNYINILILCLTVLMLLKNKLLYGYIFLVLYISFVWDNRTGLLCCAVLLCIKLFEYSKILTVLFVSFCIIYGAQLVQNTRLAEQGLDSLRWVTQLDALDDLLNLQHPFGGYINYLGDTEWLHNVYLDGYRVAGLLAVITLLFFTIYAFFTFTRDRFFYRLLCVIMMVVISMSSIIFEGTHLEFLFYFILLYNSYFIKSSPKNLFNQQV